MNLYETLGVKQDAKTETIRKAYRRKAKKAHPDTGGSAEEFAKLKKAHDILTDDARRKKYDATGDQSEARPDNAMSVIVQILAVAMENVISQIEGRMGEPTEFDIVNDMKIIIGGHLDECQRKRDQFKRTLAKTQKLVGRFGVEKGDNYLEKIVQGKISALTNNISQCDNQESPIKKALDILTISSFKSEYGGGKENHQYGGNSPSSFWLADLMNKDMGRSF